MTPFCWPFRTKVGTASPVDANGHWTGEFVPDSVSSQWRRIDQGQDLQGVGNTEEDVLAIGAGVVTFAHDPGSDGGHFGDPYPVEHLDVPVDGVGAIYYGHVHPTVPQGMYVRQGERIAVTSTPGGGGVVYGHWLEIGPWNGGPTGNGRWMHDHLVDAPAFAVPVPPVPIEEDDVAYIAYTDPTHNPTQLVIVGPLVIPLAAESDVQPWLDAGAKRVQMSTGEFDHVLAHAS